MPDAIAVLNAGSSSLKFSVFAERGNALELTARGQTEGLYTAPGTDKSLSFPGSLGGMNWGSISTDPVHGFIFVNDMRLGLWIQMIPSQNKALVHAILRALAGGVRSLSPRLVTEPVLSGAGFAAWASTSRRISTGSGAPTRSCAPPAMSARSTS